MLLGRELNDQFAPRNRLEHRLRRESVVVKQENGLGKDRFAGDQRLENAPKLFLGPRVMLISAIEERDERTRVRDQTNAGHNP